jgi:hypothetical protein
MHVISTSRRLPSSCAVDVGVHDGRNGSGVGAESGSAIQRGCNRSSSEPLTPRSQAKVVCAKWAWRMLGMHVTLHGPSGT